MKKERTKGFVFGALFMALIVSLSITALAASQTISVNGGVKLRIDGVDFVPKDANGNVVDIFEYNGTTYVPVRAVSQAFGKEISWDAGNRTVIIGNQTAGNSDVSAGSYSRQSPAPIGVEQVITINNYLQKYTAAIKINNVIRGDSAWRLIQAANQFNSEPASGKEYILINATVTIKSIDGDKAISISDYDFDTFSSGNTEYPRAFVITPEPVLSGDLYEGASLTGYFSVLIDKEDASPKIVYGRNFDGSGGIWFAIS